MIDIIIPHYGDQELLDRCLASIERNTRPEHRVIVIDNNEHNRGFARACNEGIQQGDGGYVVLLNNDVEVPVGWLESMLAVAESDEHIAAVGPLSSAPTQWQWAHNVAKLLGRNLPADDYVTGDQVDFPDALAFFCTLIPRRMFDRIGPLDEQFFMYAEDTDWCMRAQEAGYKLALDLSTVVRHDHRAGYSEEVQRIHQESVEKLRKKWGQRAAWMRKYDVLCGILNQDSANVVLVGRLMHMLMEKPPFVNRLAFEFSNRKPIADNRNALVKQCLDDGWDYLLMIDEDNPPTRNPLDLVGLGLDIIGFPTLIWNIKRSQKMPLYWNVGKWNPETEMWHRLQYLGNEGLTEVDAVGTGCFLVHRRVLEHPDMRAPFMRIFNEDGIAIRGLDLEMCRRAKEAGFRVHVHTDYVCDHYKKISLLQVWKLVLGKYEMPALNGREKRIEILRERELEAVLSPH